MRKVSLEGIICFKGTPNPKPEDFGPKVIYDFMDMMHVFGAVRLLEAGTWRFMASYI